MNRGAIAIGLAAFVGACATTAGSPSKGGALIDRYDETELKRIVTGLGYSVVDTDVSASGKPLMSVEAGDELAFRIMGETCTGEGKDQVCRGVQLSAQFGHSGADFDNLIENGNRTLRPAKLFPVDVGMAYERYLIMDGGITEENLTTNITVFVEIMQIIQERL